MQFTEVIHDHWRARGVPVGASSPSPLVPERLCLLTFLGLIIAYTLAPFNFSFSGPQLLNRAREALDIATTGGLSGIAGHFVAFFVLGCLIVAVYERSLGQGGLARLAWVSASFCIVLEFAQLLLEGRHARAADAFSNFAGVLGGAISAAHCGSVRAVRVRVQQSIRRHQLGFQAGVFILAMIIWCSAGLLPVLGSLEMDWDSEYRLLLANEIDGSRPWLGEIRYVGIYGRALASREVFLLHANLGVRMKDFEKMGLLAGYDFTQGYLDEVVPAGLLRSRDLAIQIPESLRLGHGGTGISVRGDSLLTSRGAASELTARITSSGAFSIEAWVRPYNRTQGGPARIVSLSNGITSRNFTLGQSASQGVFRVRNGINGPNGSEYALQVKGVVQNSLQHWVAVYDHGVSSMFLDGRLLASPVDLREPPVGLLLGTGPPGRAIAAFLLVMTLALPAYSLCFPLGFGLVRHLTAMLVAFCAGSLPYAAVCLLLGGPWRPDLFLWILGTFAVAYPFCFLYVRRLDFSDFGPARPRPMDVTLLR